MARKYTYEEKLNIVEGYLMVILHYLKKHMN